MTSIQFAAHSFALFLSTVTHVYGNPMLVRMQRVGDIAFNERKAAGQFMNIGGLIGMVILIFVAAALLPSAITEIEDANTTGWDPSAVALWGIVGIVIVAAFVVGIWGAMR